MSDSRRKHMWNAPVVTIAIQCVAGELAWTVNTDAEAVRELLTDGVPIFCQRHRPERIPDTANGFYVDGDSALALLNWANVVALVEVR